MKTGINLALKLISAMHIALLILVHTAQVGSCPLRTKAGMVVYLDGKERYRAFKLLRVSTHENWD